MVSTVTFFDAKINISVDFGNNKGLFSQLFDCRFECPTAKDNLQITISHSLIGNIFFPVSLHSPITVCFGLNNNFYQFHFVFAAQRFIKKSLLREQNSFKLFPTKNDVQNKSAFSINADRQKTMCWFHRRAFNIEFWFIQRRNRRRAIY